MAYDEDGIWTPDPEQEEPQQPSPQQREAAPAPAPAPAADEWADFKLQAPQQQTAAPAPAADEWADFKLQAPQQATAPTAGTSAAPDEWADFKLQSPQQQQPQQPQPQPQPKAEPESSGWGAFARQAIEAIPSTLAGLSGGAIAAGIGSTIGRVAGGVGGSALLPGAGSVAGWIGGGLAGGMAGEYAYTKAKEMLGYKPELQLAIDAKEHPWASAAGQVAPLALGLSPGRGLQTGARLLSGGIGGGIEAGSQLVQGEFSPERLAANVAAGVALPGNRAWLSNLEQRGAGAAARVGKAFERPPEPVIPGERPATAAPGEWAPSEWTPGEWAPGRQEPPPAGAEVPPDGRPPPAGGAETPPGGGGWTPGEWTPGEWAPDKGSTPAKPSTTTGEQGVPLQPDQPHGTPGATAAAGTAEAQAPPPKVPGHGPEDWGKKTAPSAPGEAAGVNVGAVDPTLTHAMNPQAAAAQQAGPMKDLEQRLATILAGHPADAPAGLRQIADDYRKMGQEGNAKKVEDVAKAVEADHATRPPPAEPPPPAAPPPPPAAAPPPVAPAVPPKAAAAIRQSKLAAERPAAPPLVGDDIPGSYAETRAAPEPIVDKTPANVAGDFRVEPNPAGPGHVITRGGEMLPGVYPTKGPAFIAMNKMAREAPAEVGGTTGARLLQRGFTQEEVSRMPPARAQEILAGDYTPQEARARGIVQPGPAAAEPKPAPIPGSKAAQRAEAEAAVAAFEAKKAAAAQPEKPLYPHAALPKPKLEKALEKARAESSKITDELIAAGRGRETGRDILKKTDELSQRYKANSEQVMSLQDEANRRQTWGGTLKPIPEAHRDSFYAAKKGQQFQQQEQPFQQAQQTQPGGATRTPSPGGPPPPPTPGVAGAHERVMARIAPEPSMLDKVPRTAGQVKDLWRKIYTAAKNEFDPIEQLAKRDPSLKPEENFGMLARLTNGLRGRVVQALDHGTYDINTRKINGEGLKTVLAPVADDMDKFTTYAMSKRALELHKRDIETGIDNADARQLVAAGAAKYEKTFRALNDYQSRQLDNLHKAGVISADSLARMRALNAEYVPFHRMIDPQSDLGQQVGAGLKTHDPLHGIKGSEREIINPVDTIIKNTYLYTAIAERNVALRALEDWAHKNPGVLERDRSTRPTTVKTEELQRWMDKHGIADFADEVLTVFRPDAFRPNSDTIRIFNNGKSHVYKVSDPAIANAVNAMDREQLHWITQLLSKPASLLRAGAVLSPEFIARNPIRDQFSAWINSKHGYIPVYDMLKGAHELVTKGKDFQDWMIHGGANSTLVGLDRKTIGMSGTTAMEKAGNVIKSPIEALRIASELMENATRLGEFMRAKGTGASSLEAAFASREVTLDFARVGAQARAMNALIPFFNAQLEGIDRTARAFRDNPIGTLTKVGMGITAPSVALWFANKDDPRYKEMAQWQKDLFWPILTDKWVNIDTKDAAKIGAAYKRQIGDQWQRNDGTIYRIPKPFEVGVIFGSLVERMLEAFYKDNPKAFKDFGKTAVQGLGPLGIFVNPKEGIKAWTPAAIDPMIEHFANRSSFMDRALVPKSMEDRKPEHQFNERTSETAKFAGSLIAKIDPKTSLGSPMIIDNYIRGYTGGLGQYMVGAMDKILETTGAIDKPATKPTMAAADTPLLRAFVARFPDSGAESIQRFYDVWDDRKTSKAEISRARQLGDKDEQRQLQREDKALKAADPIHQQIGRLHKQVAETMRDKDMSADDKRAKIDTTYLKMITLAQRGVENFERRKKANAPSQ